MQAARQGDRARASELLQAVVEQDPEHEEALLWLAALAEDPEQSVVYLQRVLDINPHNARAQTGLQWAKERIQAAEALSKAPTRPAWGGTVDLVPLEPERTRWRLSSVVGLIGVLLLAGALVWWGAPWIVQLVGLAKPGARVMEAVPTTLPSATGTLPPPTVTVIATHTPSPLPLTATPAVLAAIATDTPSPLPPTATATVVTAIATDTPSPLPSTATATVAATVPTSTPSPVPPTATVTATPTVTPLTVPTPATVWPTPGPTTTPLITPEPTPLSHVAGEATPTPHRPGQPPFPGRG